MRASRLLPGLALLAAMIAVLFLVGVLDVEAVRSALGLRAGPEAVAPEAIEASADDARPVAPELAAAGRPGRTPAELAADARAAAAATAAPPKAIAPVGLDGEVVRGDGRPAAGAKVTLVAVDGTTFAAVVGSDGAFRVEAPPGRYDLFVRGGLDGALFLADVWVDGRPLPGTLELAPAIALRVEAQLDGRPLEGATARLRWAPEGGAVPRVVVEGATDRDGVFEGDAVPPGRYAVEVDAAPGVTALRTVDAPQPTTVVVKFPPLGRWTGRVTDAATGVPLAANVVLLVGLEEGATARASATADSAGVFAVLAPRARHGRSMSRRKAMRRSRRRAGRPTRWSPRSGPCVAKTWSATSRCVAGRRSSASSRTSRRRSRSRGSRSSGGPRGSVRRRRSARGAHRRDG